MGKAEARAKDRRQDRVAKVVWGLLLMGLGVIFTLDNYGFADVVDLWRYPARAALDGNPRTRWASAWSDPQWIEIDLGARQEITKVTLNWEKAFARAYRIEVSDDGAHWTTAKEVTEGDGETDDHPLSAHGRYLRIYGTTRATRYGYSLWEVEVFGPAGEPSLEAPTAPAPPHLLSRGKRATASSREKAHHWSLFWPLVLVGLGLPALLAPKNDGDQIFGLFLTAVGAFLQAQRLGLVDWQLAELWPLMLVVAGLLLVVQAVRQAGPRNGGSLPLANGAGRGGQGPL